MGNSSFVVIYAKVKVAPPAHAADYERHFATKPAALNFCVRVLEFGGTVQEVIHLIGGAEDAVLDGLQLAQAIDCQRALLTMPDLLHK